MFETNACKVSINCPVCGKRIEDDLDEFPSPKMDADSAWQSCDSIGGILVCSNCGKEVDYSVSVDFNGNIICKPDNLEIIEY